MILSWIWNILLIPSAIWLSVTYTAWWMFLVLLVANPIKIAKRSRD